MPFLNLLAMTDDDVKAIYAYLKHLGPAGQHAPAYVPSDKTPAGPFVQFPLRRRPRNPDVERHAPPCRVLLPGLMNSHVHLD